MQHLKSRAQFQAVLAGSTVARTPHFALHQLVFPPTVEADAVSPVPPLFPRRELCVGAMVPKRWARRAVTRNTIKRQIRAVTAEFAPQMPVAAYVLRLRAGFDRKQFISATSDALKATVRAELQLLLHRLAGTAMAKAGAAAAAPPRARPDPRARSVPTGTAAALPSHGDGA